MASRSIAALGGASLLLFGLALLSWLAIEQHHGGPDSAVVTQPVVQRRVTAVGPASSTAEQQRPVAATAAAAVATLQPGDVEVCGFGVAKAGEDSAAAALERRANWQNDDPAFAQLARMRRIADVKTRAAALMVERNHGALVEMALRSNDVAVYSFAVHLCDQYRAADGQVPVACQQVSLEQAARWDSDNGAVWLHLATKAFERQDEEGVRAALHRAGVATVVKQRQLDFASLALAALPVDLPPPERMSAVVAIIGMQAALVVPSYRGATSYCAKPRLIDANRRQTCDAVAELLVDKGHSLLDLAIGRRIGEWADWPSERVELLSARLEAKTLALYNEISKAPGGMVGCAAMQLTERWHRDIALNGEAAAAEALLAEARVTETEMLTSYRQSAARRAAAQSAATAASHAGSATPALSTDRSPAASTR